MASETFLKLSKLTKHMFVQTNDKDKQPYLVDLIIDLPESNKELKTH